MNQCPQCLQRENDRYEAAYKLLDYRDYERMRKSFESVVTSMQTDLAKYAARPDASQKAVNVRTDMINQLVDAYDFLNRFIIDLDWTSTSYYMNWSRLFGDTQKLVIFCKLHGIDPDMIFYYSQEELTLMQNNGLRFKVPERDFANLRMRGMGADGTYEFDYIDPAAEPEFSSGAELKKYLADNEEKLETLRHANEKYSKVQSYLNGARMLRMRRKMAVIA